MGSRRVGEFYTDQIDEEISFFVDSAANMDIVNIIWSKETGLK